MTTTQKTLPLTLSQEEVLVILSLFKAEGLLGFDATVFDDLSKSELNLVMRVAERGLLARKYIGVDRKKGLVLTPFLYAMVGACVAPEQTLVLNLNFKGIASRTAFFHRSRKMHVYHDVPMPAFHQFVGFEDQKQLVQATVSLLELAGANVNEVNFKFEISETLITEAREAIEKGKGKKDVLVILKKGSDADEAALAAFATSLAERIFNHVLVKYDHTRDEKGAESGFSLLMGADILWKLQPEQANAGIISVASILSLDAIRDVQALFGLR